MYDQEHLLDRIVDIGVSDAVHEKPPPDEVLVSAKRVSHFAG
jgi:hypothetical protein